MKSIISALRPIGIVNGHSEWSPLFTWDYAFARFESGSNGHIKHCINVTIFQLVLLHWIAYFSHGLIGDHHLHKSHQTTWVEIITNGLWFSSEFISHWCNKQANWTLMHKHESCTSATTITCWNILDVCLWHGYNLRNRPSNTQTTRQRFE